MENLSLEEQKIILEEESNLAHLQVQNMDQTQKDQNDFLIQQIYELRESLEGANSDDIPQITEAIQRISTIVYRTNEDNKHFNIDSPYFAHMKLNDGKRIRGYYLGTTVYNSPDHKIQIVDWRTSPVSVIFYRYQEEEEYEEEIGGKLFDGVVLSKRTLTVQNAKLLRVQIGDNTYSRNMEGNWIKQEHEQHSLKGGTGKAVRASNQKMFKPELGSGSDGKIRKDKLLPEISALLDPSQYDLITRPSSGIVAIQGTAGSGKTTVALHRVAWLHYQDKQKFKPHKILVMVFSRALSNYIRMVLPSLGVEGVRIEVYDDWSSKLRKQHFKHLLPEKYTDATPSSAIKIKKHPALLKIIDEYCAEKNEGFHKKLRSSLDDHVYNAIPWNMLKKEGFLKQLQLLDHWINKTGVEIKMRFPGSISDGKNIMRNLYDYYKPDLKLEENLILYWEEIFIDFKKLKKKLKEYTTFNDETIDEAIWWCRQLYVQRVDVLYDSRVTKAIERSDKMRQSYRTEMESDFKLEESDSHYQNSASENFDHPVQHEKKKEKVKKKKFGSAALDSEDDAILLYFYQKLVGSLKAKDQSYLKYNHIVIDEAQDLSPLDLKNIISTSSKEKSITIAGDVHQKMVQYNGFEDWNQVFKDLNIESQKISPLKVSYRSSYEIMHFSMEILGDLAKADEVQAQKHGAPVELFQFIFQGEMTAWLSESLKKLAFSEPHASIAVICGNTDAAVQYFDLLDKFEIPKLRLVADQDFSFTAGVDVTDVKQVKGLEFDYVILLDVDTVNYPDNDYSKFLLHIASTRAAHQLWLMNYRKASLILPQWLTDEARAY